MILYYLTGIYNYHTTFNFLIMHIKTHFNFYRFLYTLAACTIAFICTAQDFTYDGINYSVISETEKTCTTRRGGSNLWGYYPGNPQARGFVSIPETVLYEGDEYKVVEIGRNSFVDCQEITSIELPSTISTIGERAFMRCMNMEGELTLPESIITVDKEAFSNCRSLTGTLFIPENLTEIAEMAFEGCQNIEEIVLPHTLSSIGKGAFRGCEGVTEVEIPASVTFLGDEAFSDCVSLTSVALLSTSVTKVSNRLFKGCVSLESIILPDWITEIGIHSFESCKSLMDVVMSPYLTTIQWGAFSRCSSLSHIDFPESLTYIGAGAFVGTAFVTFDWPETVTEIQGNMFSSCDFLESVNIPETVTQIKMYAFRSCGSLESIDIPDSMEWIDIFAFEDCTALKTVKFGKNLKEIGSSAFYNCDNVRKVISYNPEPPEANSNFFGSGIDESIYRDKIFTRPEEADLYVPFSSIELYRNSIGWDRFKNYYPIEEDVTAVGEVDKELFSETLIYNLQGVRMGSDVNALSPGIYIINGKKVVVR